MEPAVVARLRESFNMLAKDNPVQITEHFYDRLFRVHPELRPMFPAEMSKQKMGLASALSLVVKSADNLSKIEDVLLKMGARHVAYGTKNEHYGIIADNCINTLKELAGDAWQPQWEQDWATALNLVATVMIRGSDEFIAKQKANATQSAN
jgi:hemoglobin-like flavoprotein